MKKQQIMTKRKLKKIDFARSLRRGCVHIHATSNNTIVTLTDITGLTLAWSSAGLCGFKGTRKSTPFAARCAGEQIATQCRKQNISQIDILVRGTGKGREAALRGLLNRNTRIRLIRDLSCLPHNGCRPPQPRCP